LVFDRPTNGGRIMPQDHENFADYHQAMLRMKRAHERGTGCNLTAVMIKSMSVTGFHDIWVNYDIAHPGMPQ
jgi:hypothetical protein